MAWLFSDEQTEATDFVRDRLVRESAIVPAHWALEVVNVLAMAERRQRVSVADADYFLRLLADLEIQFDEIPPQKLLETLPGLCRHFGLTSYDGAYLELAIRRQLPLATLDGDLRRAALAAGVSLIGI